MLVTASLRVHDEEGVEATRRAERRALHEAHGFGRLNKRSRRSLDWDMVVVKDVQRDLQYRVTAQGELQRV